METLKIDGPTGVLEGMFDERFADVVDVFVTNFRERNELGASLCVTHDGRTVIDVWGGSADEGRPWTSDTISIVHSCTKGATALCAHVLIDRGELDLEAPVAEYWPEFARNGKDRATVRMMLDHSVGVPVFRGRLEPGELLDWDRVIARLEAEEPFWEPGARNGYHMINFGWTVGELVRRVSGRSLGTFFADEIARPLGLDFWIGLPESEESRVAPLVSHLPEPGQRLSLFAETLLGDPTSIPALAMANVTTINPNSRPYHAAEIGGGGGITNARGLADGLVSSEAVDRMRRISVATNDDATLRIATRFALGFMVSMDNRDKPDKDSVVLGEHAFGHVGAGGSIGFADPALGVAAGYTMNRMGPGILLNERGQRIVDALYRTVVA
jgi:CubicO group peptidase (beta-lactamase class C family)